MTNEVKEQEEAEEIIMVYGIDDANIRLLRYFFCGWYDILDVTDCFTDILAIKPTAVFMNPDKMSDDKFEALNQTFANEDCTMLIFTGEPKNTPVYRYHVIDMEEDCDIRLKIIQEHLNHRKIILENLHWKRNPALLDKVILIDEEMSGLNRYSDELVYVNAAYLEKNVIKARFEIFIKPEEPISKEIEEIIQISNEQLEDGMDAESAMTKISELCTTAQWVIFDENFVYPYFMRAKCKAGLKNHFFMLDLITLVINLYPNIIVRRFSDLKDVVEIEDEDSDLDIMIKVFDKVYCRLMNK